MKARVKATGEIVEVAVEMDFRDPNKPPQFYYQRKDKAAVRYKEKELEFTVTYDVLFSGELKDFGATPYTQTKDPDYWECLKHQYAGMAMQSLIMKDCNIDDIVSISDEVAHALVEKMKEKEERK